MKKTLCLVVLTVGAAAGASTMQPVPGTVPTATMPTTQASMDMNSMAMAHFQQQGDMPMQHPTMQAMKEMDRQYMVHPEHARKHDELLQQAYHAGFHAGVMASGTYMQSAINSMGHAFTMHQRATAAPQK